MARLRNQRGAATLEISFAVVILMAICLFSVDFTLFAWAYGVTSHAAYDAARSLAVTTGTPQRAIEACRAAMSGGHLDLARTECQVAVTANGATVIGHVIYRRQALAPGWGLLLGGGAGPREILVTATVNLPKEGA